MLVLAILMLTVPVIVTVAGHATSVRLERETRTAVQEAAYLRQAFEDGFVREWLVRTSSGVVLTPDAEVPMIVLLDESWAVGTNDQDNVKPRSIRICAFDQCGMVPLPLTGPGSPYRLAIPSTILRRIDKATSQWGVSPLRAHPRGLDEFYLASATSPFPEAAEGSQNAHALGTYIATHQIPYHADKPRSSDARAVFNVNTSPFSLLELAMRMTGRSGGLEAIRMARAEGRFASQISSLRTESNRSPVVNPWHASFASSSWAWTFRIDVSVDEVEQSWWCVYQRMDSQQWECTQRLVIRD